MSILYYKWWVYRYIHKIFILLGGCFPRFSVISLNHLTDRHYNDFYLNEPYFCIDFWTFSPHTYEYCRRCKRLYVLYDKSDIIYFHTYYSSMTSVKIQKKSPITQWTQNHTITHFIFNSLNRPYHYLCYYYYYLLFKIK